MRRTRVGAAGVTWLCTLLGYQALWIQLPVAASFGAAIALPRPSAGLTGWLLAGPGAVTLGSTGYLHLSVLTAVALFAYYVCGRIVGLGLFLRRMDGE